MCDSEKAKLARAYLDESSSSKVPVDGLLLWLDTRGTIAGERCSSKHEDDADGAGKKKFVVTSQDRLSPHFLYSEGLALLDNSRSVKTIFTLHSDVLKQREVGDGNSFYYCRRNGGRLVRQIDRDVGDTGDEAERDSRITCCIVVAYGTKDPEWEAKVTREMIAYDRVLKYEEIVEVESYLSERWKVKLVDIPDEKTRLDAKRVDILKAKV